VIITDIKKEITKITETNHKDTYECYRWWVSYMNPIKYLIIR